ncbi:MAG TPA: ABC transporter ATP-binding protein, partial [Syntrophaceticus sp.]|nr:ABC transporter ATP-binding protein [Syntrophaceticus sp.]
MSAEKKDRRQLQALRSGGGHGHFRRAPVEKAKDFKGTLKRLLMFLKPHRFKLYTVIVLSVLSTAFSIMSPKIMGKVTTELFEGVLAKHKGIPGTGIDFSYIANILFVLVALYLISAVFNYLQQYIMVDVAQNTVFQMRSEINDKLSKLPLKFFDSHTHGEILSRVTNDVDTISSSLGESFSQVITAIVMLVGIIVMMLTISPVMTLMVCFVVIPLSFIVTKYVTSRSQKYFVQQQRVLGELNGHVEEMYTGHQIVKAFGMEENSISKFNQLNEDLYDSGWKAQFMSGVIMPLMNLINNLGYVVVCVIGGIYVMKRVITIGDMQAFIQYSKQFTRPISQTASIANIFQAIVASAERVFEVLDEPEEEPDSPEAKVIEFPRGDLQLQNVKFGYTEDVTVIDNMNIDVEKGQTIAIVGPTGAGKTTLVNLLMRFYEIEAGKITIDGMDIKEIKRGELRSIFGMVLQDAWLFNGTIRENIAYGNAGATDEEIVRAAKAAHADHFIRTLPGGYDTILKEDASNISQGQKQLLTIARAILADPAILILDEATSSVDTRTELLIQKAMTRLMHGRTSFVIAHRLSTIREADIILVMHNGRVIEKGTHAELLEDALPLCITRIISASRIVDSLWAITKLVLPCMSLFI